jgi:hypothetical protein
VAAHNLPDSRSPGCPPPPPLHTHFSPAGCGARSLVRTQAVRTVLCSVAGPPHAHVCTCASAGSTPPQQQGRPLPNPDSSHPSTPPRLCHIHLPRKHHVRGHNKLSASRPRVPPVCWAGTGTGTDISCMRRPLCPSPCCSAGGRPRWAAPAPCGGSAALPAGGTPRAPDALKSTVCLGRRIPLPCRPVQMEPPLWAGTPHVLPGCCCARSPPLTRCATPATLKCSNNQSSLPAGCCYPPRCLSVFVWARPAHHAWPHTCCP